MQIKVFKDQSHSLVGANFEYATASLSALFDP